MEQAKSEYQTRMERFQASKEEMSMRCMFASMTTMYSHYSSLYKRMETLQDAMYEVSNCISDLW